MLAAEDGVEGYFTRVIRDIFAARIRRAIRDVLLIFILRQYAPPPYQKFSTFSLFIIIWALPTPISHRSLVSSLFIYDSLKPERCRAFDAAAFSPAAAQLPLMMTAAAAGRLISRGGALRRR